MVVAAGEDERVFHQLLKFNLAMGGADEIDAEVGFSARDSLQALVGTDVQNADANTRIGLGEAADRTW